MTVPEDDRGLLLGDGLFETILAEEGQLRFFDEHVARLTRGCAVIGVAPPDPGEVRRAAEATLAGSDLSRGRAVVRLTLTAGSGRGLERPQGARGRLLAFASPAPSPAGPARLATVTVRRNQSSPTSRIKSLSYLDNVLARREARALGADEALMLNTAGELACAAAANLFWIREGRLFTPPLDCGVLDGIMRNQAIIAARAMGAAVEEARAGPQALQGAEAIFLTNSLIGVRPVGALDGAAVAQSALTKAISSRCS